MMTNHKATANAGISIPSLLQDIVLESADVSHFLSDLAALSVAHLSTPRNEVQCSVTLMRPRKTGTVASSSTGALQMDELQYFFGDGPCLTAARTQETVYVGDSTGDTRWRAYLQFTANSGFHSVLATPIPLDGDARASLNLYATESAAFNADARQAADLFARQASKSLRLAVRIGRLTDTVDNLHAAMANRTVIDIAAGIIMGQNRCSHDAAMNVLKAASNARNIKLRDVATAVVASASSQAPATHFDD